MNERINELAKQATEDIMGVKILNKDRFAELIVQECAQLASEPTSLPYDSYSEKIKKHFGFEE